MKRIFLTLATLSTVALVTAFVLGWQLENAAALESQADVSRHMLISLAALVFAALVHAIVLTYFMGTGRWLEETGQAYHLEKRWHRRSQRLKYLTVPAMVGCLTLLVLVGASGGGADPASPIRFAGWAGLSAAQIHLWLSCATLALNFVVNAWEYRAIDENGRLVQEVLQEVRRIRGEKGLPLGG